MNALNKIRVQLICVANKVDTSIEYANLRHNQHLQKVQVLPEDPRPPGVSWYDYLHPSSTPSERITASSFVKDVLVPNQLLMDRVYDGWLNDQTTKNSNTIPSSQNIEDGSISCEKQKDEHVASGCPATSTKPETQCGRFRLR